MINGNINQFLDTGWYSEATIFYQNFIYWCEADTDPETGLTHFWVDKWKAVNEDNKIFHSIENSKHELEGFEHVFDIRCKSVDSIKKQFLEARIFNGKSFWQVEHEIAWLEEGTEIME